MLLNDYDVSKICSVDMVCLEGVSVSVATDLSVNDDDSIFLDDKDDIDDSVLLDDRNVIHDLAMLDDRDNTNKLKELFPSNLCNETCQRRDIVLDTFKKVLKVGFLCLLKFIFYFY